MSLCPKDWGAIPASSWIRFARSRSEPEGQPEEPRQLEGRKIIVVANLEPVRLTGVTSQGMLVAATNNACGCKVIFVDDSVPEGTPIR